MTAHPSLPLLVRAELTKLLSRVSVRLALVVVALIAVVIPLLGLAVSLSMAPAPGTVVAADAEPFGFTGGAVLGGVSAVRDFFVFRVLLIAVISASIAGEWSARTFREDLLRPVSRGQVLAAKWIALQVFVALGTLVPMLVALPLCAGFFGIEEVGPHVRDMGLSWVGDVGFCTLMMAISMSVRSVSGTIGGGVLYWILDWSVGMGLYSLETFRPLVDNMLRGMNALEQATPLIDIGIALRPWLPSAATNLVWPAAGQPWLWQSYAALVLLTAASYLLAHVVLQSADVD